MISNKANRRFRGVVDDLSVAAGWFDLTIVGTTEFSALRESGGLSWVMNGVVGPSAEPESPLGFESEGLPWGMGGSEDPSAEPDPLLGCESEGIGLGSRAIDNSALRVEASDVSDLSSTVAPAVGPVTVS